MISVLFSTIWFDYLALALSSSRKLEGAGERLIDRGEKRICRVSFDFSVQMLLKGAVTLKGSEAKWLFGKLRAFRWLA